MGSLLPSLAQGSFTPGFDLMSPSPFAGGVSDHFLPVMGPPQRGCFVDSGDDAGGGMVVEIKPTGNYKTVEDLLNRVEPHAKHVEGVNAHMLINLPWVLSQKPDRGTAGRVLRLLKDHADRERFAADWLKLDLRQDPGEWDDFLDTLRAGPYLLKDAGVELKFPKALWNDDGEWRRWMEGQAEIFFRHHMKLTGHQAEDEIRIRIEREKKNYAALFPLKAGAHPLIRDSLALIPGGMFMMGADDLVYSNDRKDSAPVHAVWVSSFLMMDVSVTKEMWLELMGDRLFFRPGSGCWVDSCTLRRPMVRVSRLDALELIKKIQFEEKGKIDLPTEAEHEYAAKTNRDLLFGTLSGRISPEEARYGHSTEGKRYSEETVNVRNFPANNFMIHGLCGNVKEWCRDGEIKYKDQAVINPVGPSKPVGGRFAVRGGSWASAGDPGSWWGNCGRLRTAYREFNYSDTRSNEIGFRMVVRPVET